MTPLVIIFLAVFVVGPSACLLLLRLARSNRRSIGHIWVAWIAVILFLAQRFSLLDNLLLMRRWTAMIRALATTVPWFGLASARMMTF